MSKRGNAEVIMFLAVAVTALGGIIFFLLPNSNTGMAYIPPELNPGDVRMNMLDCQAAYCFGRPPGVPRHLWHEPLAGKELQDCLVWCQTQGGVSPAQYFPGTYGSYESPTGNFVIPAAKEYGGAIRGVAVPGTRAFPAGRAFEEGLPDQSCYTCSCLDQKITSVTKEAAERVCTDNCGGTITATVVGNC